MATAKSCPNRRIVAIAELLRASAELYRRWRCRWTRRAGMAADRRALSQSVIVRDAGAAFRTLRHHIQQTIDQSFSSSALNGQDHGLVPMTKR